MEKNTSAATRVLECVGIVSIFAIAVAIGLIVGVNEGYDQGFKEGYEKGWYEGRVELVESIPRCLAGNVKHSVQSVMRQLYITATYEKWDKEK